jgi:hypothetical protein
MKIKKLHAVIVIFIIALMVMVIVAGSGCKQKIGQKNTETAIEISKITETAVEISNSKVPDGWPDAVPVNNDIQIQLSGSQKTEGKTSWSISGIFEGSGEDLYKYYLDKLSGWNKDIDSVSDGDAGNQGKTYVLNYSNDRYLVSIFVTDNKKEVKVLLGVTEK